MWHVEAQALFRQITELNAEIGDFLREASIADGIVWDLPILSEALSPETIEPVMRSVSVDVIVAALGNIYRQPGQHPSTVVRHPGYVLIERINPHFFFTVDALNAAKSALHQHVKTLPAGSRARNTGEAFPGVSMLQAYRQVYAFENCPRQLLFSWAANTAASKKISRSEAVEKIEGSRFSAPDHIDPGDWLSVIDAELQQIASLPAGAVFALRKTIAPHPRLMVYFTARPVHDLSIHANLPAFFLCSPDARPVVKILKPLDRNQRSSLRKDRLAWKPLIERIGLFTL